MKSNTFGEDGEGHKLEPVLANLNPTRTQATKQSYTTVPLTQHFTIFVLFQFSSFLLLYVLPFEEHMAYTQARPMTNLFFYFLMTQKIRKGRFKITTQKYSC